MSKKTDSDFVKVFLSFEKKRSADGIIDEKIRINYTVVIKKRENANESQSKTTAVSIALSGHCSIFDHSILMNGFFRKADLILIGALVLLSFGSLLLLHSGEANHVTVKQGERILYEGALSEDAVIHADGEYHNVIRIADGEVYMESSDCPGKDCIHRGKISRSGQRIACAPNGVIISVTGREESGVDVVAG